jgi:hypothetical protein
LRRRSGWKCWRKKKSYYSTGAKKLKILVKMLMAEWAKIEYSAEESVNALTTASFLLLKKCEDL